MLIDAVNKITGTSDLYTSPIPEPFTYIPRDMPAIAVADGSITSPFLALFGRSARATGMANERVNKTGPVPVAAHAQFGPYPDEAGTGPQAQSDLQSRRKAEEIVEELYLTILSRRPTAEEVKDAAGVRHGRCAGRAVTTGSTSPGL